MANLNKVMLIGRLTRDPEVRAFSTGGKVAAFGFAVNTRKKNPSTGQWEDEPVFIDMEAFNRGEQGRQLADQVEQHLPDDYQGQLYKRLAATSTAAASEAVVAAFPTVSLVTVLVGDAGLITEPVEALGLGAVTVVAS